MYFAEDIMLIIIKHRNTETLGFFNVHRWHKLIILICIAPYTSVDFFQNVEKQMITSVFVAV